MGSNTLFLLLILACVLTLVLLFMASRRIQKEGLTVSDQSKKQHFKRSVEAVQRQQRQEQAVANMSDDSGSESVIYSKHGFGKRVEMSVDEAIVRLNKALRIEGFQILNDADVVATLHKKDMPAYRMLTAYHGELAGRALDIEPSIGLVTINATVRQDLSDIIHVEFSDPSLSIGIYNHAGLRELADDLKERVLRILQAI